MSERAMGSVRRWDTTSTKWTCWKPRGLDSPDKMRADCYYYGKPDAELLWMI